MSIETKKKMETRPIRIRHNPVNVFNAAHNKLGKLPQLVKYVAKNYDSIDFYIEVELGDGFNESQLNVLNCYSDLTRAERLENFRELALHFFARYSGFGVVEKPRDSILSKGIQISMR